MAGTGARFIKSYGAMSVTIEFMTLVEATKLQAVNKFCYDHAISRVITHTGLI